MTNILQLAHFYAMDTLYKRLRDELIHFRSNTTTNKYIVYITKVAQQFDDLPLLRVCIPYMYYDLCLRSAPLITFGP